jgi:hypothetical protein
MLEELFYVNDQLYTTRYNKFATFPLTSRLEKVMKALRERAESEA